MQSGRSAEPLLQCSRLQRGIGSRPKAPAVINFRRASRQPGDDRLSIRVGYYSCQSDEADRAHATSDNQVHSTEMFDAAHRHAVPICLTQH